MSEDEYRQYTEFRAPVTGFEFLLKIWWVLLIAGAVIVYLFSWTLIPGSWSYGYWSFIAVFAIVFWKLGTKEGFALDTSQMDDGHIGLTELNRFQLERVTTKPGIIMRMSECGPVALIGHRLLSYDSEGVLVIHPEVELQTNSAIARRVARSQEKIVREFLVLKEAPEVEASAMFVEMYEAWIEKTRQDPERLKSSGLEPKSVE